MYILQSGRHRSIQPRTPRHSSAKGSVDAEPHVWRQRLSSPPLRIRTRMLSPGIPHHHAPVHRRLTDRRQLAQLQNSHKAKPPLTAIADPDQLEVRNDQTSLGSALMEPPTELFPT
ncbi:unnamed protein product [Mortierella alpina]